MHTLTRHDENVKETMAHGLRIIGDVHGDLDAFRHAVATKRFIIQLGDLVDYGPDSAGVLRLMLEVMEQERGLFLIGNHDRKLGRALWASGYAHPPIWKRRSTSLLDQKMPISTRPSCPRWPKLRHGLSWGGLCSCMVPSTHECSWKHRRPPLNG